MELSLNIESISAFVCQTNLLFTLKQYLLWRDFSKLPTVLGTWVRQRAITLCFGPKFGPKQGIIAH